MLTRKQKEKAVKDLVDKFSKSKLVLFTNFAPKGEKGLGVIRMQELRRILREKEIQYQVVKKKLVDLVLKELKLKEPDIKNFKGSLSLAFGYNDEVAAAKLSYNFSRTNPALVLLGGLLEKEWLDADRILELAKLPEKEELLANLVRTINSPLSGFINLINSPLRGLIGVLANLAGNK